MSESESLISNGKNDAKPHVLLTGGKKYPASLCFMYVHNNIEKNVDSKNKILSGFSLLRFANNTCKMKRRFEETRCCPCANLSGLKKDEFLGFSNNKVEVMLIRWHCRLRSWKLGNPERRYQSIKPKWYDFKGSKTTSSESIFKFYSLLERTK